MSSVNDRELPHRLRYWRKSRGETVTTVGAALNVTHGHVSRLETGGRDLTLNMILRAAEFFDCQPADIFSSENGGLSEPERRMIDAYRKAEPAVQSAFLAMARHVSGGGG